MRYFIALRLKRKSDGLIGLENIGAKLLDSNYEPKDPAFRNMLEGLDISPSDNGTSVFWFLVEDANQSLEELMAFNETEAVISYSWFEEEKNKVRYYRGTEYFDATLALAKQVQLKDATRTIEYQVKRRAA